MKVTMITTMAGPKGVVRAGGVASVTPAKAKALIAGGYALPYKEPAKPAETTSEPPAAENTSGPDETEKGSDEETREPGESEDDDKAETAGPRPRGRFGRFISSLKR